MIEPYRHMDPARFDDPKVALAQKEAIAEVRAHLGKTWPLIIGGRPVDTADHTVSRNPSRLDEVVGSVAKAGPEHVEAALEAAWKAFPTWRDAGAAARARVLFKAAAIMRRRRFQLNAWEMIEAGKTWAEADGDVTEAVDFLEYYARQMIRLAGPIEVTSLSGEEDEAFYIPLGVGAIIPPWNFPLAILAGMTCSAAVAGNPVLLKPASPTQVIGAQFMEIMREAGLPEGVINFVPGEGSQIGDLLVGHPRVRFISFTGSRQVGLHIVERAAAHAPGQRWVKRVIAEMGGKDAIVADETADVPSVVAGIVSAAFGFQGQKCSACSRAIITEPIYHEVLQGIVDRTKNLRLGSPEDPATDVGPVITEQAYKKILGYIEDGPKYGRLIAGGGAPSGQGLFVEPTIFEGVKPDSPLGQEEIFGPVLSVMRARDFAHALEIANDTEYGLTGSLYSKVRSRIEHARHSFHVGNLYINRPCTGSIVGAHPFGGFDMSGTDSKTGSPDYLTLFLQMKAVAERFF